jgi:signal peptidase II
MWITAILFLILVVADQVSKYFALTMLDPENPIEIGSFVKFQLLPNKGAAFGLLENHPWVLVVISGVATILLGYLAMRNDWKHGKFNAIGTTMAFAGCVGNLIDRALTLVGARGGVIDMIYFGPWNWFLGLFGGGENTFNVADVLLVFGLIILIIDYLFLYDKRARKYGYYSKRKKS